ncbi:hypothetical protein [Dysgonomonas mossii]|uniref:hypothetical protein n=1 Tax=Dysgonomonas mossii TaxID=163665 RepID=UPI003994E4BF
MSSSFVYIFVTESSKRKQDRIDKYYKDFIGEYNTPAVSVLCEVTFTDDSSVQIVRVKLSLDIEENDDEFFFYCNGIEELKKLCDKTAENFIITEIDSFYAD